jgi:hypothetical protein
MIEYSQMKMDNTSPELILQEHSHDSCCHPPLGGPKLHRSIDFIIHIGYYFINTCGLTASIAVVKKSVPLFERLFYNHLYRPSVFRSLIF